MVDVVDVVEEKTEMAARFANRRDAGRRLAERLIEYFGGHDAEDVLVLGLSPGGVPVAAEVARALRAPLDVLVVRTVVMPGSELAVGVIASDERPVLDRNALRDLRVSPEELAAAVGKERTALRRSERHYRHGRPAVSPTGRTAVLVADGLAGGPTATAAVRALISRGPARLVVAAPVCDARLAADLSRKVDDLVFLHLAWYLHAIGPWYEDFREVTEREVTNLLDQRASIR